MEKENNLSTKSDEGASDALDVIRGSFAEFVLAVKDYAIFALNKSGHITTWNEGAKRIKGYTRDEILGKHFSIFYTTEDKERNHPAFELQQALKNGSYEEEGWRVKKDGTVFWAAVTITPIMSKEGGFIKVTRDLTERRRYESKLEEARDQAVAANKLKSQFVANVTHELRTPLSSLVGLSELLMRGGIPQAEIQKTAATMFESSNLLLAMLNDLLDFAKLEAGKTTVQSIPYSIKTVLLDVIELVRNKADGKGLALTSAVSRDLPDRLLGDPQRVRQILVNLLDNAIKFTASGAIEIVAMERQNHVFVAVTDTGIGISKEKQEKLFKPFSQVHESNPKYSGTGLGLSIADQYIRLMGGEIGINSEENSGSTFWFVLPIVPTEAVSHG
jgi:osomolarity two-component system sensor histidine kinase TcsA